MRTYRHKEDRYEVKVRDCSLSDYHNVYGYYEMGDLPLSLKTQDLERLFEPIGGYCCDSFAHLVADGEFVWAEGYDTWRSTKGNKSNIRYCQFCGQLPRKPREKS